MNIEQKLLTPNEYSRPKTKRNKMTKIIVHYVGNSNSTAIANRNYFENCKDKKTYASSHYIIGLQGEIIQCVPENEIAYTSNQANAYSIGIECCHPLSDGKFNKLTYDSLIELLSDICTRYKLNPLEDLLRHYDITGKMCPLWYVNNPKDWIKLKQDVYNLKNKSSSVVNPTVIPKPITPVTVSTPSPIQNPTNYKITDANLSNFVTHGVISSPDYWKNLSIQYLNDLFTNSKDLVHKNINNGIVDFDKALSILQSAKIINSPDYWITTCKTIKYLDLLIINIANKCKIILQKIVQAEAGGEDEKGKVLVANVIVNRVKHKSFPNTIYDVVFQKNQFQPTRNGAYDKSIPSKETIIAVDKALNGNDESKGALYFRTISGATATSWHETALTKLFDWKNHRFYK